MALCNNAILSLLNKKTTIFKYLIFLKFNYFIYIIIYLF